jgi:hypothetical protein
LNIYLWTSALLLKVEVLYVNGKPASYKDFLIRIDEDGAFKEERNVRTNGDGRAMSIFQTSTGTLRISFMVRFFLIQVFLTNYTLLCYHLIIGNEHTFYSMYMLTKVSEE